MQGLKRVLAAFLAAWLAGAPAASAAELSRASAPAPSVSLPSAPLAPALASPALASQALALPSLALPSQASPALASLPLAQPASGTGPRALAPAALPQLRAAADPRLPASAAGAGFDGGRLPSAAAGEVAGADASGGAPRLSGPDSGASDGSRGSGAQAPSPGRVPAPAPAPKRPSWLKRLNQATRPTRTEKWLERSVLLGAILATAAPIVWHARPFHTLLMNAPAALLPLVALSAGMTLFRAGRFLLGRQPAAARAPPKRARLWAAAAVGLMLGAGLGAAPVAFQPQLVQAVDARMTPQGGAVAVPGDALQMRVVADLSANPVGRRVLDGLRDRSGAIRLPAFLVRNETDAIASHVAIYDAVFIGAAEIKGMGWTVEEFLKDPAKQARYVDQNQGVFAHELTHALQARRSPLEPGQLSGTMEYEYEAYVTEHFYVHEQLRADPHRKDLGSELGSYEVQLDDIDGFLKDLDSDAGYKKNTHLDSPRYRAWYAQLHAQWPAHRLEGYALLARRYAGQPYFQRRLRQEASAVAKQYGLPLPPELAATTPAEVR